MPEPVYRMRAPTGEVQDVPAAEVDFFRKKGAVLIGQVSPTGEVQRPPSTNHPYKDIALGLRASVATPALYAEDLLRRGFNAVVQPETPLPSVYDDPRAQAAREVPNSMAGTLGKLGGDIIGYGKVLKGASLLGRAAGFGRAGMLATESAVGAGMGGLQTEGDPTAIVAGGAFPGIMAARGALPTGAMGRAGKMGVDATIGAGAGYTLSGGDPNMAAAGALGLPAATSALALTRGAVGAAGRAASGAREGGLGGAVGSVLRGAVNDDPYRMIVQAVKPRNALLDFDKHLPNIVPRVKAVAESLGLPLNGLDDVLEATKAAKQAVRAHYDEIAGPFREMGVDLTGVARQQLASIPKSLAIDNPEAYARAVKRAANYDGLVVPLGNAETFLKEANAALEGHYGKFPMGQRKQLANVPKIAAAEAKAKAIREAIYGALDDPNLPTSARETNRTYGQLMAFEDAMFRRRNVANRQQPESLNEQFSKVRAAGEAARGVWRLSHGDMSGLADFASARAQSAAATWMKEQQTTDMLLKRAFAKVRPAGPFPTVPPAAGPPSGGPIVNPPRPGLPQGTTASQTFTGQPSPDPSGTVRGATGPGYAQPEMRPGQRALPAGEPAPELAPSPVDDYIKARQAGAYNPTTMLGVIGPTAAQGIPDDPESQWDEYARLALNVGGAAALGAAFKGNKAWRPTLEKIFPKLDAYNKPRGFIKPAKMVELAKAHPEATPEMIAAVEAYAGSRKGKPVKPTEIVDRLSATKHERGRVLYDMKGVKGKPLTGAPIWVTSPEKEAESLSGYLQLVNDGVAGRGFYKESGKAFLEAAGDNPALAHRLSRAAAITSPRTDVAGNTGHAVRGHGQAVAGVPVRTGAFPTAMSKEIEKVYRGNITDIGPKREPFVRQIAMGGEFATESEKTTRAVHDLWEGEAFRYVNPDGTPQRKGFGVAQHAWMDKMTDRAIAEANANKLGGFDDWDAGTLQAAAWTGAKLRAGDIKEGQAAKSFADYLKRYYMQTGREVIAGTSAQHMPELASNPAALDYYVKQVADILYDPKGREKAAMAKDMLVGGSLTGPGIFRGVITPGRQVMQMAGTTGKPKIVDPANMKIIKANEAEYGMLMAQDAIAGSMVNREALKGTRDIFDLQLPSGKLAMNDPLLVQPTMKAAIAADKVAVIPIDEGVRIINLDMSAPDFDAFMRGQVKATKGTVQPGKNLGFYEGQQWNVPEGKAGQHYARLILDIPSGEAGFNKSAPGVAKQLNELDRYMSKTYGVTLNNAIIELREAIAANGMDGVRALAKQYGVPLSVLLALAQTHRMFPSKEEA